MNPSGQRALGRAFRTFKAMSDGLHQELEAL
jgi:hypothetical protein